MVSIRSCRTLAGTYGGLLTAVLVAGGACTGSEAEPETCVPGQVLSCRCPDGRSGMQTCSPDGQLLDCDCSGSELDGGVPEAGMPARRMVNVAGGPFIIGCDESEDPACEPSERPRRTEAISSFAVDALEVSVADYELCVLAGACPIVELALDEACNWARAGRELHPMNCVTWSEAQAYCEWVGKRLLDDTEWEKAARGTDGRRYPWGDEAPTCELSNLATCTGSTTVVGGHPLGASPYGVQDIAGNVWEWVQDQHSSEPTRRVRGGGYTDGPNEHRAAHRAHRDPGTRSPSVGIRCADDSADRAILTEALVKASVCEDTPITARFHGYVTAAYSGHVGGMPLFFRQWIRCMSGVTDCSQFYSCDFDRQCTNGAGSCSGTQLVCARPGVPEFVHECADRVDENLQCGLQFGVAACIAGPCDEPVSYCDGDVAVECRGGALVRTPCAKMAAKCVNTPVDSHCVHETRDCANGEVHCMGATLARCEGEPSQPRGGGVLLQDCSAAVRGGICLEDRVSNQDYVCGVPPERAECEEGSVDCRGSVGRVCARGAWIEFDCASVENRRCQVVSGTELRCVLP